MLLNYSHPQETTLRVFAFLARVLAPSISWYKTPASTKSPRMTARTSEKKCRMVYIRMLTANSAELEAEAVRFDLGLISCELESAWCAAGNAEAGRR